MAESPLDNKFFCDYIKNLNEKMKQNDLRTPARVNREKGVIEVDKKAFEDWRNTQQGKEAIRRMVRFSIQGFDIIMYDKELHRKEPIKDVVEFIQYLERHIKNETDETGNLSTHGHLYSAKLMQIKSSFCFRLFWYNLYLKLKPKNYGRKH